MQKKTHTKQTAKIFAKLHTNLSQI